MNQFPEKVKKGLECCNTYNNCQNCPYDDKVEKGWGCCVQRNADALTYIRQLEVKVAEYEQELDLLKQYAPPVTPGTIIYSVVPDEHCRFCSVIKSKVADIWYNSNGWFFTEEDHKGPAFSSRYIGRIIFLDEAAAQQKRMEINEIRRNTHG